MLLEFMKLKMLNIFFLENCLEAAADTKYIYLCLVGLQLVNGPRIDWGIGNLFVSS